ncbi:MAG: SDR family oxidoreductase [Caulobacteraceae bacterium]|nr:SDR family oxidoreductase [Caulobacteraceae bacterium]
MGFEGKTVVVTGAASGIGLATAKAFAAQGATVVAADLDTAAGEALAGEIGGDVRIQRCDVTEVDEIKALMDYAAGFNGGIHVLFNNAGSPGSPRPIDEIEADEWDATLGLLLRSVAMGIRHAVPHMRGRAGASIVNTASTAGHRAELGPTAYAIAKAAVLQLTKRAASDLARHGIRVNSVSPGIIGTRMMIAGLGAPADQLEWAQARFAEAAARTQPVARPGAAEDIASAVVYLASDAGSFMNGTDMLVDGGITLGGRRAWDPTAPKPFEDLRREFDAVAGRG